MLRRFLVAIWSAALLCGAPASADDVTDRTIAEAARQETRGVLSRDLLGHYDVVDLAVRKIEDVRGQNSLGPDYALVRAVLTFSTRRNATRHAGLNRAMFEPGSAMCQGWLYLHCGVPVGHVFEGKLELLLAFAGDGVWRAVPPHWRSRSAYPLDGYLLLEGRPKEGYVLFPK